MSNFFYLIAETIADASDDVDPNEKLQSILGSEEGEADPQGF
jgi:hypothetical protein